jgi:Cu(I)/Ag(I) efflux system membrane fusion protein
MTRENNPARRTLLLVTAMVLGLVVGGGAVYAHFRGVLTPIYHAVGLHRGAGDHSGHQAGTAAGTAENPSAHAGHGAAASVTAPSSKLPGYSVVTIPTDRQQLIGVRTGAVVRDDLVMSVRTVGIIEPDQTRLAQLHTRVSGWVTKVHVNFVGKPVKRGDTLI